VLTDSFNKIKLNDPFILSLVKNIDKKRSSLIDLESININSKFSNIVSDKDGDDFYIKNQFHKAKGFRKLHVEIAEFSGNLKILHCVFFPDPLYDIPIFGLDIVKVNKLVTAAIVDLSPVSNSEKNLYKEKMYNVSKEGFRTIRKIPEWGNIFSENVFFATLNDEYEQNLFYEIVDQYLTILIEVSFKVLPDILNENIEERISFQRKYCMQQMKNEKTSLVLKNYFDKSWVEKYIKEILFDFQ
tara:strand:+ start:6835 stop:7563 length:729 start_codon:yes stop_codon:yes gene_type:complete